MAASSSALMRMVTVGWLCVNIPVTVIIIAGWIIAIHFDVPYFPSLLIGGAVGWGYWELSIRPWIRWANKSGATREQIVSVGRKALLHWGSSTIEKVLGKA